MHSFQPSRFGGSGDPWFRIGTFDIGSAAFLSLASFIGMLVYAFEPIDKPLARLLAFNTDEILSGQIWRIFTYWIPNEPGFFELISIVLVFLFGNQLEGALGRVRMLRFLIVLGLIPVVTLLILHITGIDRSVFIGVSIIGSGLFYAFIAYMPHARSFFNIPLWWFGAFFFGITILGAISARNTQALVLEVAVVGGALTAARSFGLAPELHWIPDLSGGSSGGSRPTRPARPSRARRKSNLRPVETNPIADDLADMEIDALLDQVATDGLDSLTKAQRQRLEEHSKRMRKRKD